MANLWAFGDSWVYGDGVPGDETFASFLADDLKLTCVNHGLPGSSNSSILFRLKRNIKFISKDDVVLIVWTSPHRDEFSETYNKRRTYSEDKYYISLLPYQIREAERILSSHKVIMTQAFNPLFGYDYVVDDSYTPKTFIEWGKPNNTLLDVITYNWCEDNQKNIFMTRTKPALSHEEFFSGDRKHPSALGNRIIADLLLEYYKGKPRKKRTKDKKLLWDKNELI